jgi:probable HAF family extracellular repeat protein
MTGESYLKTTLTTFAVLFLLAQVTSGALPRYEIIDLGTIGGDQSAAKFINDRGQIVGSAYNQQGNRRATLFDSTGNGNNIDLGTLGGTTSWVWSINHSGQIVGYAENQQGYGRATLFDPTGSGKNIDLGTLGELRSNALSINDSGQIIGSARNGQEYQRATLFDPTGGGNNIDLGTLGSIHSQAWSINDRGQIVGNARILRGYWHATLFDPTSGGNNIDLGTLGGNSSNAHSINNLGQIVGWAANPWGDNRATLFDPTGGGKNIELGTLVGILSWAHSINDLGQIVGAAEYQQREARATLFDPTGKGNNIDLNTIIKPASGWILTNAFCINNHGWIVGNQFNQEGQGRAFLMKPVPRIIYVDDDASGTNDGSSWADAFNYLQDALTVAWSGDEIRVAQGIYKPDEGAVVTTGDREATFQLINGVALKGGYAGFDEPDPNAWDIDENRTILSGDLAGNDKKMNDPCDLLTEPTRAENSYHVVTGSGTDSTAILDGFTITSGNASASNYNYKGGGMINEDGSPTVTNCRFTENFANGWGGGMCNTVYSYPTLTNCTFGRNSSREYGGGMLNFYSDPTLINCIFVGNSAGRDGGGGKGGGIHNDSGSPTLTNCVFSGNSAGYIGGGIYNESASAPILTNCTFSGNSGVAIFTEGCTTVTNCIFWGNTDNNGTGEPAQFGFYGDYSKININYSCVQGWTGDLGGVGNMGADPLFVEPDYWDVNGVWIDGDYHLLIDSPCIDAGDPNYVTEPNETDLDGNPRIMAGRIDMGAYESPLQAEARIVPRTINLASKGNWITCYIRLPKGYNVDDIEINSVLLEDTVPAASLSVDEQKKVATAKFICEEVQAILEAGDINLKITGRLTDGTVFEGTDTIKVLDKAGKN